jgi:hypothetical protein
MMIRRYLHSVPWKRVLLLFLLILNGCAFKKEVKNSLPYFTEIPNSQTGVLFKNELVFTDEFNIFTYRNFYNGGGVAIGDINNDGLSDLYFTSNQTKNKLYLNRGSFVFEDITETAGVGGSRAWSTGVSMADVNGDGYLDIYVCNSGDVMGDNKQNELFINNGDLTFSDQAEAYGIADTGYSTHAVFFDFDRDQDLDMYLLNNSYQAIGSFNLMNNIRHIRDSVGGDKLYRNDGDRFVDVSEEMGIFGSVIGFGLGVSVGDFNNDFWPDIFVSNDFFERDYLYLNDKGKKFSEVLPDRMKSISAASMGSDAADLNNDGLLDLFVTDMLPEQANRLKQVTTFENWDKFQFGFANGYHYQYTRNMLHANTGDAFFSEIGRMAGVEATDWSWGALMFDVDLDGYKDLFVANGIYQDITDLDYLSFIADEKNMKQIVSTGKVNYRALVDPIPSNPIPNFIFQNMGNFTFKNQTVEWGLGRPTHSNGAAYGDLDNDGDLDLVISNVNDFCSVYRNNTPHDSVNGNNFLRISLSYTGKNIYGIGSKIKVFERGAFQSYEQMPNRGFQSSVDTKLVIGVSKADFIDSVVVIWPDERITKIQNVKSNQELHIDYENSSLVKRPDCSLAKSAILKEFTVPAGIHFLHQENVFSDFNRERLIYHMLSTAGPALTVGDVNGDGLDDFYVGGAKGQSGQLYVQNQAGKFHVLDNPAFRLDSSSEDVDAIFFDMDNDKDLDLFVASGGYEFTFGAPELHDRLYLNNGKGIFTKSNQRSLSSLANVSSALAASDIDGDGFVDLFVGCRALPFAYGIKPTSYILINDGNGQLVESSAKVAPELKSIGHVTDAIWSDTNGDKLDDLIVVGEWMTPTIFVNSPNSVFTKKEIPNLEGWWNSIEAHDLNGDGNDEYILGNHGLNSRFKASIESPILLYTNDFDRNGSLEHIYARKVNDKIIPYTLRHELVSQIPSLKKKFLKFVDYKDSQLSDIFDKQVISTASMLTCVTLSSGILINTNEKFVFHAFPRMAQVSPVYDVVVDDFNDDGFRDIILGGNFFEAKPEVGRYDASVGLMLLGDSVLNFRIVPKTTSGIAIDGAIRKIREIKTGNRIGYLFGINSDSIRLYSY